MTYGLWGGRSICKILGDTHEEKTFCGKMRS